MAHAGSAISGGFVGGPLASDPARLGSYAVDLAASFPQWVRRRKTTFSFVDEATVILRRSVDIVLPARNWFGAGPPAADSIIYVPLDIFRKETLSGFSTFDGNGDALSVLNTEENATLTSEGLSAFADGNHGGQKGKFLDAIREVVVAETAAEGKAAYDRTMAGDLQQVLPAGGQYDALLQDLQASFLLLVPVPYRPGANHIFKVEWSTPYRWREPGIGSALRTIAASLGMADQELRFSDLPIGFAHGTHFEFRSPAGVRNRETVLTVDQPATDEERGSLPARRTVYIKPHANVNVSIRDKADVVKCRSDVASVILRLRPHRGGTFLAIVVVAWLTAALLLVISERLARLDGQTSAGVVLALPAVLTAYLVRTGEHPIASRLRAGIRMVGLLIAGLALTAAILIGVGELREPQPARPQAAECRPQAVGAQPARRAVNAAEELACSVSPEDPADPVANASLQRAVAILGSVAAAAAILLSAGLLLTHLATRSAARNAARQQIGTT